MKTENTEGAILTAADKLFTQRGYNATSTTDIAREAGCNQALVHYYFRTKENLFQKVFIDRLESIIERLQAPLVKGDDLFSTLRHIVDTYFDILAENPQTPSFLLGEMVLNPERESLIHQAISQSLLLQDFFHRFSDAVGSAIQRGEIRKIDPKELYLNIVSLVVFSHLVLPLASKLTGLAAGEFLARRREEVYKQILYGLTQ